MFLCLHAHAARSADTQPPKKTTPKKTKPFKVVLLRNRDRIQLLWPPVFDHLVAIIRGKGVDGALVQVAASGVLRLCQRLLPYRPDAAEPLLRGLQLVPSLDPEVRVFEGRSVLLLLCV